MTDDDRKPGAGWDLVEDLLAEEAIERSMAMPADERRAAMKAEGLDPERARVLANEALAKHGFPTAPAEPGKPPTVVHLATAREKRRPARPAWVVWAVAAAVAAILATGGGAIVALNTPAPSGTTPAPPVPTGPPGPSPEELAQRGRAKAEELRKVAAAECAAEKWVACNAHLDDASRLDPQGDEARRVVRLRGKVVRGQILETIESKEAPAPRAVRPDGKARMVTALAASKGQALRLVCATSAEPSRLCDQLVAALASAGWVVTRAAIAPAAGDAAVVRGMRVEVATDADDATQAAADVLAGGLETAMLLARGPDDVAPAADAPLRLTVGVQ
jgi:hypothetical protein